MITCGLFKIFENFHGSYDNFLMNPKLTVSSVSEFYAIRQVKQCVRDTATHTPVCLQHVVNIDMGARYLYLNTMFWFRKLLSLGQTETKFLIDVEKYDSIGRLHLKDP